MQRSTFKVLFYVKRQSEKSGQIPVMAVLRSTVRCRSSAANSPSVLPSGMPKLIKPPAKVSNRSALMRSWRISRPISANNINVSATGMRMLRPKRFVTPFWAWARIALYNFDEYLADFLKRIGKYHAYSSYKDYCKRHRRLAVFLKYEYHSLRLRPSALRTLRGLAPRRGRGRASFRYFRPPATDRRP